MYLKGFKHKKQLLIISLLVIISCIIMALVDAVIQPKYIVKSAIKIILFLIVPFIYGFFDKEFVWVGVVVPL